MKSFKNLENSANLYLGHSMTSGSFNKMKAFEKPLLKQNRNKYNHKFLVERKQINLQSSKKEKSNTQREKLIKSRIKLRKITQK